MPTQFPHTLHPDPPIQLDANYRFDHPDRRYIDDQVRALETFTSELLINGVHGGYVTLDASSAAVIPGDGVVPHPSGTGTVTKAVGAALVAAGGCAAIVLLAASPGAKVKVALGGYLPPSVTQLAPGNPGLVRINSTTGHVERVSFPVPTDAIVGTVAASGVLTMAPLPIGVTPQFTPTMLGSRLRHWLRSDVSLVEGTGPDVGKVASFADQSGAAIHFSPRDPSKLAGITANARANKPAATFVGATPTIYLAASGSSLSFERTDPFTWWFAFRTTGAGNQTLCMKGSTTARQVTFTHLGTGNGEVVISSTLALFIQVRFALSLSAFHSVIIQYDGSSLAAGVQVVVDGAAVTASIISDTLGANSIVNANRAGLGAMNPDATPINTWTGEFYEEGMMNGLLTASELNSFIAYQRATWLF